MIPDEQNVLVFYVNGNKVVENEVNPEWTLLHYLRKKLRLCGTKLGCAEGGCGACTVMVSKYDRTQGKIIHLPVNACLAPVCSMHGLAVTTIEGIGSTKTRLHPVQERLAKAHGSQCGFCTPGIVMSMYTLLRDLHKPTMKDMEIAFQGNLCRCTGYRPIIEGYRSFTTDGKEFTENGFNLTKRNGAISGHEITETNEICGMGDKCCRMQNKCIKTDDEEEGVLFDSREFTPYDPTQEPIFPAELKLYDTLDTQNLIFKGENVTWYRPTKLSQLLDLKQKYPEAKIVVGNTEVGVEVKIRRCAYPIIIQPTLISEMTEIECTDCGIKLGASVTLLEMEYVLKKQIRLLPEYKTRIFAAIVDMLNWFAGKQIRSVAAVGGNIMTGSPISDLNPIFMASKIQLELCSKINGQRFVTMDDKFFTGYRQNIVQNNEILLSILIPFTSMYQYFYAYKQARRRDDDIAIVNCAVNVTFQQESDIIHQLDLAFGGMSPVTITAPLISKSLIGLPWNKDTLDKAFKSLIEDLPLLPNAPGGMIQYRKSLTLSFFFKAFLAISEQLQVYLPKISIGEREKNAMHSFHNKIPKSSQYFQILTTGEKINSIGTPIPHMAAYKHATGEAAYCDDIPTYSNELYMALVTSTKAHARIVSIDASEALAIKGVKTLFTSKDISEEQNKIGTAVLDEEIFTSRIVQCQGQVIGVIIADDMTTAQQAARKVRITYEDLEPVIVTLDEAIQHKSFFYEIPKKIDNGDIDEVFSTAPHVIEGDCRTGAQEHFYLETQCTIAVPKNEGCEMEIFCSSQNPSEINRLAARLLNTSENLIVTKVKRMGGGFGGKETRAYSVALPAVFAASKLNCPVRCMLDRDEDMVITGTRHPFYIKYKVAFDDNGKVLGCEIYLYNNGGYSLDLSVAVLERALLHFENAYKIPVVRAIGYVCKTNLPSNTAFRGFGGPQGMFAGENMLRKIAEYLDKDFIDIASINLYKEGDLTHYNQKLERCTVEMCWKECINSSNYFLRKNLVQQYNSGSRWKKRGITIVPTKFGIAFTYLTYNQAGALVHVYTDGSVLLSHAGTEMGQGLHTKMIQVASQVLEIPVTKIHINDTSTDKVPNTSATAASCGSDLNGMAVKQACETIKQRLEPYRKQFPAGNWNDWVMAAYKDRVSLSSTGFYKTPDIGYDWDTNSGNAFNYFTVGAACSEVEIDCLTGDHQVLRTDIVMDVGESLNPAIDIGQIEGGFMQGYGLFVLEEMVYSPTGTVLSRGPGAYKLPGFGDIPSEFNVSLLKGSSNPRAVYSSKAIGEPPLFLASSIFFAIKEAIKAARSDSGVPVNEFKFDAPATSAKIRMACQDHITSQLTEAKPGTFTPWNVVP